MTALPFEDAVAGGGAARVRAALAAAASIEMRPADVDRLCEWGDRLHRGATVYVPFLPNGSFSGSLAAARTLLSAGMEPVLHVPARRVASREELADVLAEARAAGVETILLIAGDLDAPAGPFANTLDILDSGLVEACGIRRVGFAGHPEGHPVARPDALAAALSHKARFAEASGLEAFLVTQFVFEAAPLVRFDRALREAGHRLPVRAGLPGPAGVRTLLTFGLQLGVATSARAFARRPETARLLGRWTPQPILEDLADHLAETPDSLIAGIHLFPFGGVGRALDWLAEAGVPSGT